MLRPILFATALLISLPAVAKDVTITLNDQEQKVFLALLDGALKQGGLSNLQSVVQFVHKYQQAVGLAAAPTPATPQQKK